MLSTLFKRHTKGFTIVELIIVITVIAILAALSIIAYNGIQQAARDNSVLSDAEAVEVEVTRYGSKHEGVYGSAVEWYSGGVANPHIDFTPTTGNVIDVVANNTDYCVRAYNGGANKNSITNASIKESAPGICIGLNPSVAAGGSGTKSLVGWWKLNGSSVDDSGNGNHGVTSGGTAVTTGQNNKANGAYSFDGISGEIVMPDSTSLSPSTTVTLSAWVKVAVNPGTRVGIVNKDVSVGIGSPPYGFELSAAGDLGWIVASSLNVPVILTCSGFTLSTSTWYLLVGVFEGSTMKFYINGQLCVATASQTSVADTTGSFRIGQQKTGSNRWFTGSVDDVRVYNTALSAAQVTTLYGLGAQ